MLVNSPKLLIHVCMHAEMGEDEIVEAVCEWIRIWIGVWIMGGGCVSHWSQHVCFKSVARQGVRTGIPIVAPDFLLGLAFRLVIWGRFWLIV